MVLVYSDFNRVNVISRKNVLEFVGNEATMISDLSFDALIYEISWIEFHVLYDHFAFLFNS